MRKTLAATLALSLLSTSALAAVEWTFQNVDADQNLEVTEQEFVAGAAETEIYGNWDANDDAAIAQDEFAAGLYDVWDADDDAQLTEAEFTENWDGWFGEEETADFGAWDTDASGWLSEEEWGAGIESAGLYDTWDADTSGTLAENEFYEGLYGVADADDGGYLTEDEFATYEEDDDWLF